MLGKIALHFNRQSSPASSAILPCSDVACTSVASYPENVEHIIRVCVGMPSPFRTLRLTLARFNVVPASTDGGYLRRLAIAESKGAGGNLGVVAGSLDNPENWNPASREAVSVCEAALFCLSWVAWQSWAILPFSDGVYASGLYPGSGRGTSLEPCASRDALRLSATGSRGVSTDSARLALFSVSTAQYQVRLSGMSSR